MTGSLNQKNISVINKFDFKIAYLEIFIKTKSYFSDPSGNNPLLRNDKLKLFPDAPKSLNYWLGFRIISKYVEKHGTDSWKDIYNLTAKEVLEKSDYEKYIEKL